MTKLTPEMQQAWVDLDIGFEPKEPLTISQCGFVRSVFFAGWAAALEAPHSMTGAIDETGWLIEENAGGFIHWIALAKDAWPRTKENRFSRRFSFEDYLTPVERVKDANEALRFARKQDAEAFIELFRIFLLCPVATEHGWPAMQAARPIDREDGGASPLATGFSQAEPEVSALRASIPSAVGVRRGFDLISAHIEYIERENLRLNELLSTYYVNALRGDADQLIAFIKDYGHDVHRDRKTLSAAIGEFQASGTEAGTGETVGLDPKGDGPVAESETPIPGPIAPVQDDDDA